MTRVEKATSFVATAQADLDAALAAGTDTGEARERLRLAEQELKDAQAAQVQDEVAGKDEIIRARMKLVHEELKAATDAANASLKDLTSVIPPTVTLSAVPLENLIRARRQHDEAREALSAHQARVDELNSRLHALTGERQAITARRTAGTRNDAEDGPKLALLNADIEGLQSLITRTRAEAPVGFEESMNEVSRLETVWRKAQEEAVAVALNDHCHVLEAALIAAATHLSKTAKPTGYVGLRYQPAQRLRTACLAGVF